MIRPNLYFKGSFLLLSWKMGRIGVRMETGRAFRVFAIVQVNMVVAWARVLIVDLEGSWHIGDMF